MYSNNKLVTVYAIYYFAVYLQICDRIEILIELSIK